MNRAEATVGAQIAIVTTDATTVDWLVGWGTATRDEVDFHYDGAAARARGFSAPVVHGPLKGAWVAAQLAMASGAQWKLVRLACRYRAPDYVGDTLRLTATIDAADPEAGTVEVRFDVANSDGLVTVSGTGTLRRVAGGTP
ncbi:MaoC/PaaZ C-terminal domain-containing protein [Microbacterium ulmi]|uniref:MaoC-like domain-containing protein n=1 Tax=Microbacterium ulmi TaxID=179095 RepID=A0A7Y2LZE2_9MICO|nr:MaoC/PaaZ C-terminal domain-containing protein [Microbacterium ulmi]NII69831.1 acyl dehydratase [Microbacterium ulmi]NNH03199.1 hypothetical protein [Microbacterium ulmi]